MKSWICVFAAMLLLASCADNGGLELPRQSVQPVEKHTSMEEQVAVAWSNLQASIPASPYTQLAQLLNQVGTNIVFNKDFGYKWSFTLLHSRQPNALSLPDGHIAVYDSMFNYIDNEGELAALITHEMAHIFAQHGMTRQKQRISARQDSLAFATALGRDSINEKDAFMVANTGFSLGGYGSPYIASHEKEADRISLLLMAHSGYDPKCALSFWQKAATVRSGVYCWDFFSLHPVDAARIAYMKMVLPEAMELYKVSSRRGSGVSLTHSRRR